MAEKTIFDNINDVFIHKTSWDDYTELEKRKFNPYMMNRWISMNPDFITIINYLQPFTIGILSSREVYKLFLDLFPKIKFFNKYIKADKESDEKIPSLLIKHICEELHCSESEALVYIKMLDKSVLIDFLKDFGYSDNDIKKQFKLK